MGVVAVLGVSESARASMDREPKPKARPATNTVNGAGQRRNTASILLEHCASLRLPARSGEDWGSQEWEQWKSNRRTLEGGIVRAFAKPVKMEWLDFSARWSSCVRRDRLG